jgi:hypothetical protein
MAPVRVHSPTRATDDDLRGPQQPVAASIPRLDLVEHDAVVRWIRHGPHVDGILHAGIEAFAESLDAFDAVAGDDGFKLSATQPHPSTSAWPSGL